MASVHASGEDIQRGLVDVLSRYTAIARPLKEKQLESLISVLKGRDTFAILPTGYGKSLIYHLLPLVHDCVSNRHSKALILVVSPLTQLIADQLDRLTKMAIRGVVLTEKDGRKSIMPEVSHAFSSPETILSLGWRSALRRDVLKERLIAVVIDEVHCVTEC